MQSDPAMLIVAVVVGFTALWVILQVLTASSDDRPSLPPLHPPTVSSPLTSTNSTEPLPVSSPAALGDAPRGHYLIWPMPVAIGCAITGLIGALVGSGGSGAGFAIAWLLNPLNWIFAYSLSQLGRIKCPHCRRSHSMQDDRNKPVDTALKCDSCGNIFLKPPA